MRLIFSLGFSALLLTGCNGDLPIQPAQKPTVDPCTQPFAARYYFRVTSQRFGCGRFVAGDTLFPGTLRLAAPPGYTAVEWRVGSDPRTFTKNPQQLDVQQPIGTVAIRFVGTRPVDKCRPGDRGVDTLFQTVTVVPYYPRRPRAAIEGVFLGATAQAPRDTFRVSIRPGLMFPGDSSSLTLIPYNLNKGCPGLEMKTCPQYRALDFNQTRGDAQCHGVGGYAALDSLDRNLLRIVYREQVTPGQPAYADRLFIGYRQR